MWKPDESLDDYVVKSDSDVTSKPPRVVSLHGTGRTRVLEPLAFEDDPARSAFIELRPPQPLWFRRFLVAGSGALVMVGLVLVSAILVGINDPVASPEIAANSSPDDRVAQPEELFSFEMSPRLNAALANGGVDVRLNARTRPARQNVQHAATKRKRPERPSLRFREPRFAPTTLVIYAENGVIKTRIEPWL